MDEKIAVKTDWNIEEMPKKTASFVLNRCFSREQMEILKRGHVPLEMEDKWFWYAEGNKLYAHRSWTGICIYIIEFKEDNNHLVTVNRNTKQYSNKDIDEDRRIVNNLLEQWSAPAYDYYGEWISETLDAINREKKENQ